MALAGLGPDRFVDDDGAVRERAGPIAFERLPIGVVVMDAAAFGKRRAFRSDDGRSNELPRTEASGNGTAGIGWRGVAIAATTSVAASPARAWVATGLFMEGILPASGASEHRPLTDRGAALLNERGSAARMSSPGPDRCGLTQRAGSGGADRSSIPRARWSNTCSGWWTLALTIGHALAADPRASKRRGRVGRWTAAGIFFITRESLMRLFRGERVPWVPVSFAWMASVYIGRRSHPRSCGPGADGRSTPTGRRAGATLPCMQVCRRCCRLARRSSRRRCWWRSARPRCPARPGERSCRCCSPTPSTAA